MNGAPPLATKVTSMKDVWIHRSKFCQGIFLVQCLGKEMHTLINELESSLQSLQSLEYTNYAFKYNFTFSKSFPRNLKKKNYIISFGSEEGTDYSNDENKLDETEGPSLVNRLNYPILTRAEPNHHGGLFSLLSDKSNTLIQSLDIDVFVTVCMNICHLLLLNVNLKGYDNNIFNNEKEKLENLVVIVYQDPHIIHLIEAGL